MPGVMLVEGWEAHGRHREFGIAADVYVRPKAGRRVPAERVLWKAARLSGALDGQWRCRVVRVPGGSEIIFSVSTERSGTGMRHFERKEYIHCAVDPRAPAVRIAGPSCCGRAPFVEGPLRIVRAVRVRGTGGPGLFSCADPKASRSARTRVFGNLWIGTGAGFPLYARRCSVHGGYEVLEDVAPADRRGMLGDRAGLLAAMIAAVRRYPDGELPGTVPRMMREIAGRPEASRHGFAYAWLRETLGQSERDIVVSLEEMAELAERPVPALAAALEPHYEFPGIVAQDAARCIFLPALAAATDSCAEYEVLRSAVWRESRRYVAGRLTAWKEALVYIRAAAEVLRNPARYVL